MGSKFKQTTTLMGSSMGLKVGDIFRYLYLSVVLLLIVHFLGNVLKETGVFHLISWNPFPTKTPHLLLDCNLRNINAFDMELLNYAMDDSRHQNVTASKVKKIYLQNEGGFSIRNRRHVSRVRGDSPLFHIHARFREILIKNAMETSYKPEVMKDMLPIVKRQMDEHYKEDKSELWDAKEGKETPQRYESCAIVGNSGVLWNSSRGHEIDSHKMVIRLNNALSKEKNQTKLEAHIGTKTTLTFMNSHVLHQCVRLFHQCRCHPFGVWVPIMLYLCTPEHAIDIACCSFEHKTPLFLTDGRFDTFVSRLATWYSVKHYLSSEKGTIEQWEIDHKHEFHYSSGFQAVITALALCEKVDLYGFGKDPQLKHHFHSDQREEYYGHDFEGEYLFYNDLEAKRFYDNPFLCEAGISIPQVQVFY